MDPLQNEMEKTREDGSWQQHDRVVELLQTD